MLALEQTKQFKKCLKKYRNEKTVLEELKVVVKRLVNAQPIPKKYRDHELTGNYAGIRELHVKPDALLLYVRLRDEKIILMALGSHAKLFQ